MTEGLSETYSAGRSVLLKKYGTAYHKAKTDTERNTILLQWWDDHEALVTGEKVTLEAVQEAAASADIPLRSLLVSSPDNYLCLESLFIVVITVFSGESIDEIVNRKRKG